MAPKEADQPARGPAGNRRWWAVAALSIGVLAVGIDLTVLNVALPTLAGSLHASTSELQWFVDSYSVVLAAGLLPAGVLGDSYGRKKLLVIALVLFGASSAACAYASSSGMLIATRAVLGLGAAVIIPLSLSVLAVLFPEDEERRKAVAVITAAALFGYPLGPVLGGWLLTEYWWGSVFLINVPVVLVALVAVVSLIPESRSRVPHRLDVPGVAISSLGLIGVTYGLIEAGQKGWGQAGPLAALSAGVVLLVGFVLYERRLARRPSGHPLIDLELFRSPSFTWGTLMATLVSFVMLGLLFVVPQYLQEVLGASTLGTGLRLLPVIGGLILGALLGNWIQGDRPGARFRADARIVVAIGFALLAAGGLIGLGTTTASGTGFAVAWLLIGGVGLGMALPAAMNTAIGAVPQEHSGAGASVIWVFRQVGGTFGVAVLGTILSSTYRARLHVPSLPPAVSSLMRESVTAGVAAAHRIPLPGLLSAVHSAFVDAMDQVLVVCAAIAVVSAVLALAMRLPRGAAVGEMRSGTLATASEEDAA